MRALFRLCLLALLSGSAYSEKLPAALSALAHGGTFAAEELRVLKPSAPALRPVVSSMTGHIVMDGLSVAPQVLTTLVDEDGRQTVAVADEDLRELVESAGGRQRCNLMAPGQSLRLDFSSDVPVPSLSQVQAFLVRCKRGTTFRFALFHKGVEVVKAPIKMRHPSSGAVTTSYLRFLTENGAPISHARFHSDGEVSALSLNALLSADGEFLVGRVEDVAAIELRLLAL